MANQEHLNILKQGVEVWNKWREEHGNTRPDLSGADLMEFKLNKIDFSGTHLSRANLNNAFL